MSSATHKFLARLDVHVTFVWVLTAVGFLSQLSIASHDVSSTEAPLLTMMISGFISISEDGFQISILDSKFILDIYHTFIHSSVQVRYLNFHLFHVLNGAAGPGLGCVVFEICSLLK